MSKDFIIIPPKDPDPTWHFTPSQGEPFSMTQGEVADAMAFVRGLMAACNHESDGQTYSSDPYRLRCHKCGEMYPA